MQDKKKFLHSHFVGVPVPPELEEVIGDCRAWMAGRFGCKSGHGTPPHITLLAPFALPEEFSERDVLEEAENALESCAKGGSFPLSVKVSGFGCFGARTLFASVEDSAQWQEAHSAFAKAFYSRILFNAKKDTRKFYPHLSVANRDIPPGAMDEALLHFAQLDLQEEFLAGSVCVYSRNAHGGWNELERISCL